MDIQGKNKGLLIVLSGPSGAGKGTICANLPYHVPDLVYSISATTRLPREGERDGVNYYFKSNDEFERMIEQEELLEWAHYVNNYYGTPRKFVEEQLTNGDDVLLEIEVQGAKQVKERFPEGIFVFLLPPSMDELACRIRGRGTEDEEVLRQRMRAAYRELEEVDHYDYVVMNDQVESACERIRAILVAEHCRRERFMKNQPNWLEGM